MRLAIFTDQHHNDSNPQSRTGNYNEDIFAKIEEIKQICTDMQVDAALCAGDVFHNKVANRVSHLLVRRCIELYSSFPCPVFGIAGNHDESQMTPLTIPKQPIGVLFQTEAIKELSMSPVVIEKDGIRVALSGSHFYADIDKDREGYFPNPAQAADLHVHLVHAIMLPPGGSFISDFTTIDMITATPADLTVTGHYHNCLGTHNIGDKWFMIPGAISRGSISESDVARKPSLVIVDVFERTNGRPNFQHYSIPLQSAKPAEEVLIVREHQEEQQRESQIAEFATMLSTQTMEIDIGSTESLLNGIVGIDHVPTTVKQRVIHYLDNATAAAD